MTLHLVGFPHTRLDGGFETCAYTQKIVKFRRMDVGRDVVVYGTAGADVELLSEFERRALFGEENPNVPPAWPTDEQWRVFNARAVAAIAERSRPVDLVLLSGGYSQRLIAAALPDLIACEPFVGYPGVTTPFCAFESVAWRHYVYGTMGRDVDGRWLDAVIPNYFDPDDFPHLNGRVGRGDDRPSEDDYLLFVGRMIVRKGIQVAAQIAAAAGIRCVFAGPGVAFASEGQIITTDGTVIEGDVEYWGPVDKDGRAKLMAGARALLAPTLYVEPFGGVAVEAMIAGTPVIASDFGAFTETVDDGRNGFRFRSLREGVEAVHRLGELAAPETIRQEALDRYSITAVAPRFAEWFSLLESIPYGGWSALPADVHVRVE